MAASYPQKPRFVSVADPAHIRGRAGLHATDDEHEALAFVREAWSLCFVLASANTKSLLS